LTARSKFAMLAKVHPKRWVLDRRARVGHMTSIPMKMKVGSAAGAIALAASLTAVAPVEAAPLPVPALRFRFCKKATLQLG
jgi:hypothetical protein